MSGPFLTWLELREYSDIPISQSLSRKQAGSLVEGRLPGILVRSGQNNSVEKAGISISDQEPKRIQTNPEP
jgi:hypothetical protein